jgi:outer membrane receptor protein involved in Fe transport
VDPADAMFTTANFPGASTADLTSARALYGFLSGRVTSVTATAALTDQGKYEYLGRSYDKFHLSEGGVVIQDQWRVTPHLTVNGGVRYQIQLAPTPEVGNYTAADIKALCGVSGTGSGLAG